MPRPRTSQPNPVSDAVRKLRESLNQTQQEFAQRLGTAITTIARWETTRPPKGKALSDLSALAHDSAALNSDSKQGDSATLFRELATLFRNALAKELGVTEIVAPSHRIIRGGPDTFFPPRTHEEAAVADAAIAMWRDRRDRPVLKKAIGPTVETLRLLQRHLNVAANPDQWSILVEQIQKGESIREACKKLKLPYVVWDIASGKGHMEGWEKK